MVLITRAIFEKNIIIIFIVIDTVIIIMYIIIFRRSISAYICTLNNLDSFAIRRFNN